MSALSREITLDDPSAAALIAELLPQGGIVQFRGHGGSMLPFLRDGDLLCVKHVNPLTLRVGDVVLYRGAGGKLIVHRIVRKKAGNNGVYFGIRGDALLRTDRHIPDSQVLGRVLPVQPNARCGNPLASAFAVRLWLAIYPLGAIAIYGASAAKKLAGGALQSLQHMPPYRWVLRRLLRSGITVRLATPDDLGALNQLYGRDYVRSMGFSPNGDRLTSGKGGRFFVAEWRKRSVGAVAMLNQAANSTSTSAWTVYGLLVRRPFRGAGIGEMLMHAVEQQAKHDGASTLRLQVVEENTAAVRLYQKMGFEAYHISELLDRPESRILDMQTFIDAEPL